MKIIVFDTETTGLPSSTEDLINQPHICQFAAILLSCNLQSGQFHETGRFEQLICPPVPISSECSAIHGITEKMVADQPSINNIIHKILGLFRESDIAVAHNISFDQRLIEFELERMGLSKIFLPPQTFDTMKESKNLCRIPGRGDTFKAPKLQELYYFLFGKDFKNAHNAMVDVLATALCLKELFDRGIFKPQEPTQTSLF